MENKSLSIGELLKFGYSTFRKNTGFLVGVFLIYSLVLAASWLLDFTHLSRTWLIILYWTLNILAVLLSMGLIKICLKYSNNETPKFSDLFTSGRQIVWFLLGSLLYGIIIMVGLLLLVFPGFIWAARYGLFSYFIIDKNQGPIEALESSARATYGAKWDYFGFLVTTGLLSIAGLLCFLVGSLITAPIVLLAGARAYHKLSATIES